MENNEKTTVLDSIRKAEAEAEAVITAAEAQAQTIITQAKQDTENIIINKKQELEQHKQQEIEAVKDTLKKKHVQEIKKAKARADAYKTKAKKKINKAVDYLLIEFTRAVKVR